MAGIENLMIVTSDGTQLNINWKGEQLPSARLLECKPHVSSIYLSKERGRRLDMIRIINGLIELGFFEDANGKKATKKEVFGVLGNALNMDFSHYSNDLSASLSDSTSMNKHLKIFEDMLDMMKKIFNFA